MNADAFELSTAIQCAEAIASLYRPNGLSATIEDKATDTQVRIEEAHVGEFFVFFPGSASRRDWRSNAQILKTEWNEDGAKVHTGFANAYGSVEMEICHELRDANSITIAGHSLGGALATLCADHLASSGADIKAVYTFGSPRVGNGAFARQYNEELEELTFRIVNARDPVPWVPLPLWVPRTGIYTHVASQVYLAHEGGFGLHSQLLHPGDLIATVTEQAQQQEFFGDILTARTHAITAYLEKLKGLYPSYA